MVRFPALTLSRAQGLCWFDCVPYGGEEDGEIRFRPDEAVVGTIRTMFS
jgi:hypothetical protein